ncbi:MAG: HD domain-containing phosphohydrolase, partial [Acidobacteriota bacterium]
GKLAVPNSILDKPGRLTEGEWAKVREHPFVTYQILDRVPVFRGFADDASNHHERLDGRGYFRGLSGDRLSRTARVLAVADVVDALASDRPYRAALDAAEVCAMLVADRGHALCPEAVDAAVAVLRASDAPGAPGALHPAS